MGRKKFVAVIILLSILCFMLWGCGYERYEKVKLNADIVKEYNDAIELYNKMALAFTRLARFVDDNADKSSGFDKEFWKEYQLKEEKVLKQVDRINSFKFKNREIEVVMDDIQSFIANLQKYLEYTDAFRDGKEGISKELFINRHKELYNNMLKQSSEIVKIFNNIYDRIIAAKE